MSDEKANLLAQAIVWIAMNDEPTVMDAREISDSVSVELIADVFGIPAIKVAMKVAKLRNEA